MAKFIEVTEIWLVNPPSASGRIKPLHINRREVTVSTFDIQSVLKTDDGNAFILLRPGPNGQMHITCEESYETVRDMIMEDSYG